MRGLVRSFILASLILLPLPVRGSDVMYLQTVNPSFTIPISLYPAVTFWKDVYSRYSIHHVVFHHRDYPAVIFEVADLTDIFGTTSYSKKQKNGYIKKRKKDLTARLLKLHKLRNKPEILSPSERALREKLKDIRQENKFLHASKKIRTQDGLKEKFAEGLALQGKYIRQILRILQEEGVPKELAVLPHVESSFNYYAYSKYGAAGIWQFTRSTGRRYMKINRYIDQRRDPIIATRAAAKHLRENFEKTGSWPLAILAYNHGLQGVQRAIKRVGSKHITDILEQYRSRIFGFASKNFYPEFLAALKVVRHYRTYVGDVEFHVPRHFETVRLARSLPVQTVVQHCEISMDDFKAYNPAYTRSVYAGRLNIPRGYEINLPAADDKDYRTMLANAVVTGRQSDPEQTHNVSPEEIRKRMEALPKGERLSLMKKGDGHFVAVQPEESVWLYARWSGVSSDHILKANFLGRRSKPRLNQVLEIPISPEEVGAFNAARNQYHDGIRSRFFARNEVYQTVEHRVTRGESVWVLCYRVYDIPFWLLQLFNDGFDWDRLPIGAKLIIPIVRQPT